MMINKTKILILFGRSGAGKDTVANWLIKNVPNTHKVILHTTRPMRDYETDGVEYYFIDDETFYGKFFKELFLTAKVFNSWAYGILKEELKRDKINVCVLDPASIADLINSSITDEYDIMPVYIYADPKTILLRNINREKNPDYVEICRRFLADENDFKYLHFPYIKFNNNYNNGELKITNIPEIKKWLAGAGEEISDIGQMSTYRRGRRA